MNTIKEKLRLLSPLYWPAWLGLSLLWSITRLPYRWQIAFGKGIGYCLYIFPSKLKHTTETNIRLCFPQLTPAEQEKLAKENFASVGAGVIEMAMAWWLSEKKLAKLVHISGLENLSAALQKNKGAIVFSPHFTCLEMIGRLMGMQFRFTSLYRPHKKAIIEFIQKRFRSRYGIDYIPRHKMRMVLDALQANQAIWYAYDIDGGKQRSVFAPFFGIQTASLTAISRITESTGASVVPIRFYRRDDGTGYEIHLSPALDHFPSEDLVADATRLNAALEEAILVKPEQYIWQYKRFKTRPDGEERIY